MTFRQLIENAPARAVVVPRFLVLLEPYRRGAVEFEQDEMLDTLTVQWTDNKGSIDIDVDDCTGVGAAHSATTSSPRVVTIETEGEDAGE